MSKRVIDQLIAAEDGAFSQSCHKHAIFRFKQLINHVHNLPYGRFKTEYSLNQLLDYGKGTCSTKHAFIKKVAEENAINHVVLVNCMYEMKEDNTPGVGEILNHTGLAYIPESHCYLLIEGEIHDLTFPGKSFALSEDEILAQAEISISDIGPKKKENHRAFIDAWLREEKINYTLAEIWDLREACIRKFASKQAI